jgi:hypothetical protein
MRVSVIETEEDYNGNIVLSDITYNNIAIEDHEDFTNPYFKWKKSKDKGVKYYREAQGNTVMILETSPYFNLIMFDSTCLESSVPRLKDYGQSDTIIDLLNIIKVPIN